MLRSLYDQRDVANVSAQPDDRLFDYVDGKLPVAYDHPDTARGTSLRSAGCSEGLWQQIWSNNPNEHERRRTLQHDRSENHSAVMMPTINAEDV